MDTAPTTPATSGPASPSSAVLTAWPRSAQLTTAFLLGVVLTLLIVQATGLLRWGSRPSELEAAPPVAYRIDLNKATKAELLQLPGVGPALVDRIMAYRQENGGFTSVEDLTKVPGIGPATLARLRTWVCVTVEEGEPRQVAATAPAAPVKKPKTTPTMTEPSEAPKTASKKEASLGSPLDINTATQAELHACPASVRAVAANHGCSRAHAVQVGR